MFTKRRLAGAAIAALLIITTTGCGEADNNAPKGVDRNTAPADMINMPFGFRNVAAKCDGPNRVYVTSRGADDGNTAQTSSIAVVPNDPRCTGAAR